eukprot:6205466-Pleurochrysis_carterae.AAC.1
MRDEAPHTSKGQQPDGRRHRLRHHVASCASHTRSLAPPAADLRELSSKQSTDTNECTSRYHCLAGGGAPSRVVTARPSSTAALVTARQRGLRRAFGRAPR